MWVEFRVLVLKVSTRKTFIKGHEWSSLKIPFYGEMFNLTLRKWQITRENLAPLTPCAFKAKVNPLELVLCLADCGADALIEYVAL